MWCNGPGDGVGVVTTGVVVVRDDEDLTVFEFLPESINPFARAHGVTRGHMPHLSQSLDILLAFHDEDRRLGVGSAKFRKLVENPINVVKVVDPLSRMIGIRPPLAKVLGILVPDDLREEPPVGRVVVVGCGDPLFGSFRVLFRSLDSGCLVF